MPRRTLVEGHHVAAAAIAVKKRVDNARKRLDRPAARAAMQIDHRVGHRALCARLQHREGKVDARAVRLVVVFGHS